MHRTRRFWATRTSSSPGWMGCGEFGLASRGPCGRTRGLTPQSDQAPRVALRGHEHRPAGAAPQPMALDEPVDRPHGEREVRSEVGAGEKGRGIHGCSRWRLRKAYRHGSASPLFRGFFRSIAHRVLRPAVRLPTPTVCSALRMHRLLYDTLLGQRQLFLPYPQAARRARTRSSVTAVTTHRPWHRSRHVRTRCVGGRPGLDSSSH